MPLRNTHLKTNKYIVLPVVLSASYLFICKDLFTLFVGSLAFLYGTYFCSPDDFDGAYKTKLLSLRGILTLPFRVSSRFFKHRGLSHHLIWGPVFKLLFIGFIWYGGAYLFSVLIAPLQMQYVLDYVNQYPEIFWYGVACLYLSDVSHIFLDSASRLARLAL